jgi:hypothetical protein
VPAGILAEVGYLVEAKLGTVARGVLTLDFRDFGPVAREGRIELVLAR